LPAGSSYSLFLAGVGWHGIETVFNAGVFVDPRLPGSRDPPWGLIGGVDLTVPLDHNGKVTFDVGIAVAGHSGGDATEYVATPGFTWTPVNPVQFSINAIGDTLVGGAAYGVMLGVSPNMQLWGKAKP
jgi:hypothetical protein